MINLQTNTRVMDIQATKLELMHLLLNTQKEHILSRVKEIFEQDGLDLDIRKQMLATAQKSNDDIQAGRIFTIEEAEAQLEQKLGF